MSQPRASWKSYLQNCVSVFFTSLMGIPVQFCLHFHWIQTHDLALLQILCRYHIRSDTNVELELQSHLIKFIGEFFFPIFLLKKWKWFVLHQRHYCRLTGDSFDVYKWKTTESWQFTSNALLFCCETHDSCICIFKTEISIHQNLFEKMNDN